MRQDQLLETSVDGPFLCLYSGNERHAALRKGCDCELSDVELFWWQTLGLDPYSTYHNVLLGIERTDITFGAALYL